jgi:Protein of unknown function DUF262
MDYKYFATQNVDSVFSYTVYFIDSYQREYQWTKEPVLRLLDDVLLKFKAQYARSSDLRPSKKAVEAEYPWYYLNTYVTNFVGGRVYDGQQRLTTLTLILIKLRHLAEKHGSQLATLIHSKIAAQAGCEQVFRMNYIGHKEAMQALFDGQDTRTINTDSGITAQNMVSNYEIISDLLNEELKDKRCFETFVFYFLQRVALINLVVEETDVPMDVKVINDRGVV